MVPSSPRCRTWPILRPRVLIFKLPYPSWRKVGPKDLAALDPWRSQLVEIRRWYAFQNATEEVPISTQSAREDLDRRGGKKPRQCPQRVARAHAASGGGDRRLEPRCPRRRNGRFTHMDVQLAKRIRKALYGAAQPGLDFSLRLGNFPGQALRREPCEIWMTVRVCADFHPGVGKFSELAP